MTPEVVAFDVHETLAHWPADRVQGIQVQELLDRYGIPVSYQALEAARQAVFFFDAARREIHGYVDFLALQFDRMGLRVSLDLIESIAAMYESRNDMVLFPDTIEALRGVRAAGKRTCAFTTLPKFMLGRAADALLPLLDDYFDISAVGLPKGDRRFYERITESLATSADRVLCVGDDPLGDCRVPAGIGWQAVLLDRSGRHEARHADAFPTISSLSELSRFL
ncbi:MAG: HAD family hydrolase [Phycisphaerae bacterium]